ncbi:MAG: hypothetical protein H7Y20_03850, partial [Bryobacteraceae bacterium]|nr:hypothetical protein [Bryobacteraceae bacterium]
MKRISIAVIFLALAGATAWTVAVRFRMKLSASGQPITVPGRSGADTLLV